ncbi:MAG: OmpA family protein [Desulfobulbaceae bacterium]|nr:OmpA family protein [Desulfobulbaceae bacterium]
MFRQAIVMAVAAIISLSAFGCVSKNAFEMMEDEATRLGTELEDLQDRYNNLKKAKVEINSQKETLEQEQIVLQADNKQLNLILEAKSDSFSEVISSLRQKMADQKDDCELQMKTDEEQIDDLGQKNNALHNELNQLRQVKEQEVAEMSSTYEELLSKMESEIDKGQVTISELKGKLTVNLVDAILFDSGKAEVKDEGLLVLQKVVDILKSVTDKAIRVEGHTDNVKIGGALARKYPTNWELSSRRAVNITRFLQAQGLNPENLSAVAYGEYAPVADNETDAGKAQNRRIEIILIAKNR